jgi:hypothetical protein
MMWNRCANLLGMILIGAALAAVPSVPVVVSYVGGSAILGFIENERYFVNPGHSMPIVEVSESTWWTVYWVEMLCPWSGLVPGFAGLYLAGRGKEPNETPLPDQMPRWVLYACMVAAGITVGGTLLFWFATRTPWATMIVGWMLVWICGGTVGHLYARSLRQKSVVGPDAPPDPARR